LKKILARDSDFGGWRVRIQGIRLLFLQQELENDFRSGDIDFAVREAGGSEIVERRDELLFSCREVGKEFLF
jgi:hypothetical protein